METKWIGVIATASVLVLFVAIVILCCIQTKFRRLCCKRTKHDVEGQTETTEEPGIQNVYSISGQEHPLFQSIPLQNVITSPGVSEFNCGHHATEDETPTSFKKRLEEQSLEDNISEQQRIEENTISEQIIEVQQQINIVPQNVFSVSDVDEDFYETEYCTPAVTDEGKILDLHGFSVSDAMDEFKSFFKEMESVHEDDSYQEEDRYINVITGRGKHSHQGIGGIKMAVQGYLDFWNISHEWKNRGGMVTIDLSS